jgi:hypothetical protein
MPCSRVLVISFIFLFPSFVVCQVPRKSFNPDDLSESYFRDLKKEFGNKKRYPPQFERQILIALSHYPELEHIPILFRIRKRHTPATTKVTVTGLFEAPETRHYVITISDSTEDMLMPLLFKNLPFNAQVGVIGHELGHVADPSTQSLFQLLKHGVRNISRKYVDRFEYNTDAICIAHGLGYQLLEWSKYVRSTMKTINWDGPDYAHRKKDRERYMNPETIEKRINENPIYKSIQP